jgi:monoamine oxidase
MIDVAIVGAGLSGLSLACELHAMGMRVQVYEARHRTGGRILTDRSAPGAAIDLGGSWYWPDTEPRMTALVQALGLASLAQPDVGEVLTLADVNEGPKVMDVQGVHGGARRLHGGMQVLMDALRHRLPEGTVHTACPVHQVRDLHEAVELSFQGALPARMPVRARHVVITLPPRLADGLGYSPPLPETLRQAMQAVPTWMALEAKVARRFQQPFWLQHGHSGSAFSSHLQSVLRENWDASDTQGAALAGFCAIPAGARPAFSKSMPLLADSQWAQWFGGEVHSQAADDTLVMLDWAQERQTCSALDLADGITSPPQADPALRRPHWGGRLLFGGTETAKVASGHMEGALESTARVLEWLRPTVTRTVDAATQAWRETLQHFHQWTALERQGAMPRYEQHIHHWLSRQDSEHVTQRAIVATAEQTYTQALEWLARIEALPATPNGAVEPLAKEILGGFAGFSKHLVAQALAFNARSCALSNFEHEHRPDADYLRAITLDLAAAWREFALATHDLLDARQRARQLAPTPPTLTALH